MAHLNMTRGGAVVACRAHNPKVAGSSPAPATKFPLLRFSLSGILTDHVRRI